MNGREVPASPEQLKLLPDDKFTVEPYTVEDCEEKTPANFKNIANKVILQTPYTGAGLSGPCGTITRSTGSLRALTAPGRKEKTRKVQ